MAFLKLSWNMILFTLVWLPYSCAQNPTDIRVMDKKFEKKLSWLLRYDVPLISVTGLHQDPLAYFILDTREKEEFEVSHIRGAHFIDYSSPDYSILNSLDKDTPIVTYCSIGYRSEKIGRQLQEKGFTQVYNLYGSIMEWVNHGYPVVDVHGSVTDSVHTYNKRWSRYMNNSEMIKTW